MGLEGLLQRVPQHRRAANEPGSTAKPGDITAVDIVGNPFVCAAASSRTRSSTSTPAPARPENNIFQGCNEPGPDPIWVGTGRVRGLQPVWGGRRADRGALRSPTPTRSSSTRPITTITSAPLDPAKDGGRHRRVALDVVDIEQAGGAVSRARTPTWATMSSRRLESRRAPSPQKCFKFVRGAHGPDGPGAVGGSRGIRQGHDVGPEATVEAGGLSDESSSRATGSHAASPGTCDSAASRRAPVSRSGFLGFLR